MADHPLAPLLDLPGVRDAADSARAAVDAVHRHPANRRGWPATAAEASMRAARASAVLDGGSGALGGLASLGGDGSSRVTDPVLAGAVRVAEALGPLLPTWQRAPLQALARLHVLAAADLASSPDTLGRPRADDAVSPRLRLLADILTAPAGGAPGVVVAAVVHGELLSLAPFDEANGVVARAAARLTAIATGLDAKGLAVPEVGHLRAAAEYRAAAAAFADGGADAVAAWVVHCCTAWTAGAAEATSIANAAAG